MRREDVEHRGLARASAATHQDVHPLIHRRVQKVRRLFRQRSPMHQLGTGQVTRREFPDRDGCAVDRQRRENHVESRPVGKSGVDHRGGLINSPTGRAHHALNHQLELLGRLESRFHPFDAPRALHKDVLVTIDHDLRHRGIVEQRLQRAKPQQLVGNGTSDGTHSGPVQLGALGGQRLGRSLFDQRTEFGLGKLRALRGVLQGITHEVDNPLRDLACREFRCNRIGNRDFARSNSNRMLGLREAIDPGSKTHRTVSRRSLRAAGADRSRSTSA